MLSVKIYIIHALKGYELHEERLQELLPQIQWPFEFITSGDPSVWNQETIDEYFVSGIKEKLSRGVLSCTLNHILAYHQAMTDEVDYAIFFENDPFFLGGIAGFRPKVEHLISELKNRREGNIVSLENTTLRFPSRREITKNKRLYQATSGRAAGAYLLDKIGIQRICYDLKKNKCHDVIDWWQNDLIERKVVSMFWAHPPLTEQGSHNGKLNAGISSKRKSFWRQIRWKAQKIYKWQILSRWKAISNKDSTYRST